MRNVFVGDYKIGKEEKNIIMDVLDSQRISEHKYVTKFEEKFKKIIGTKYCTLVNSGTSALIAALTALLYDDRYPKIKKGAKVITSPLTYVATSNAIKLVGMEPVFVDVDPETFSILPDQIEQLLEEDNQNEYCMILPVHLMGYPADMDKINHIAEKYNLITFEDTAQAHGSKYKGKITGTMSLVADYSFYIAHNIQVGEMGAVVTNDEKVNRYVKKIKANGRLCDCPICTRQSGTCPFRNAKFDPRFRHDMIGYNFKTMEFQAALGYLQLEKFDEIIEKRSYNVKKLNEGLSDFKDLLILPEKTKGVSFLAYPIIIKDCNKLNREDIRKKLTDKGVENRPLFGCIPTQQPAYSEYALAYADKLPNAEYLGNNSFYIGCHQYLNDEDIDYMISIFKEIIKI